MAKITLEKEQIPLGWHFILKASVLEKYMAEAGVDTAVHINFLRKEDVLMEGHFYLPNERVDFSRFYIRVGMVETRSYISRRSVWEKYIPQALSRWMLEQLTALEEGATLDKPRFVCSWDNEGKFRLSSDN